MTERTVAVEELAGHSLPEVLRRIAEQREALTVRLDDSTAVRIEPTPCLQPLPVLEGSVPIGWKDAIYGD